MIESKKSAAKTRRQFIGGALVGLAGGMFVLPRLRRSSRSAAPRSRPNGPMDTIFEPMPADAVKAARAKR